MNELKTTTSKIYDLEQSLSENQRLHNENDSLRAEIDRLNSAIMESIQDVKGAQFTDNTWKEAKAEQQGILAGLKAALTPGWKEAQDE